ncbi:MAG: hypothetical protein ACI9SF_000749, partial [Candidatus Nanohaloarchaea archaeon]
MEWNNPENNALLSNNDEGNVDLTAGTLDGNT